MSAFNGSTMTTLSSVTGSAFTQLRPPTTTNIVYYANDVKQHQEDMMQNLP